MESVREDQMEAVSSAKIWMKTVVNTKDLMQGVLSAPSVIHLLDQCVHFIKM